MQQASSTGQSLPPTPWQPILNGPLAARAHTALDEIAATLQPPSNLVVDASLFGGAAGLAIFYTYLALANRWENADTWAMTWLETAIAGTADEKTQLSFFRGFPGVAWATTHLQDRIFAADEDPNTAIDEALAAFLAGSPWPNLYDLVDGLVGLGVYALERLPNPCARQLLERIVDRLDVTAERTGAGITWWTAPEVLFGQQRISCPQGYYNLGLAHGVPGVIALLGRIGQAGIAQSQVTTLLEGAVAWLLAHKLPAGSGADFTFWLAEGADNEPTQLAWCYGDLGISLALLAAARSMHRADWEREALTLATAAAERSSAELLVPDGGFCHGAAGIAHLFNRLYQATQQPLFCQTAQFWFEQTLQFYQPGQGVAGFSHWRSDGDDHYGWVADPGLLTGAAGIGLTLLAATTAIEPEWDRMMLVDIPNKCTPIF